MFLDIYQQRTFNNFLKQKVTTTGTADSLYTSPQQLDFLKDQHENLQNSKIDQGTIFSIFQQRFEEKPENAKVSRLQKRVSIQNFEQDVQQCQFKVIVVLSKQKNKNLKTFIKNIIKTLEKEQDITLIFDRQYQKLKIDAKNIYIIEVFLETLDGFSKRILVQRFSLEENSNNLSVLTITSPDHQKCLNVEVQKIGKYFIKPLSFKLPLSTIEQFFDYKLKLLNKSELLSSLKSISQLRGILEPLTKQNMGSRIIQKLLGKATPQQLQSVINQLKNSFKDMILDRYGNYVFQKIFKISSNQQKQFCLKKLQPHIIQLLKSKQGTHSMQTLIVALDVQEINYWFNSFSEEDIFDLSINKFSMHFIQKLLTALPNGCLLPSLMKKFKQLAIDKQGIVVLKSVMKNNINNQIIRYKILCACQQSINQISFTQYGHYIVQQMFFYYNYFQLQNILNYIVLYASYFSQNQYSSSIIRKAIQIFRDFISIPLINSIRKEGLASIMQSSSGQFVLHRLMQLTINQQAKDLLMNQMMVQTNYVNCYEKRQKWLKFFKLI